MKRLTEMILEHAEQLPEGTPLTAKGLLRFGTRAGVDQALSRLAKRGELIRAGRGIYFLPVKSRFGTHSPSVGLAIKALADQRGETIVPNGGEAANRPDGRQERRRRLDVLGLSPRSMHGALLRRIRHQDLLG